MAAPNLDVARRNMLESQVRTWDVIDERVLELVARAPREDYVPAAYRNLAFVDMNIPLPHGQVMMAPKTEARLLQALALKPTDRVLEIGTGSGSLTALLAGLGAHVTSVEIFEDLSREAAARLAAHGIGNVTLEVGDAASGWSKGGPFDVIVLTGSVPVLPGAFREALAPGGRLFAIVGESPVMEARLIERLDGGNFRETSLFETDLPALVNAKGPARFVF
jgi:protein-L-isoaspartate(D-aspartate) O-methyltransferase